MEGVIYLHAGEKCLVRIMVSIFTLRKHYDGPVIIFQEEEPPEVLERFCKEYNITIHKMKKNNYSCYVKKPMVARDSPFDTTIFIDADTTIHADISDLFTFTKQAGLMFTRFSSWVTTGKIISGRIRKYENLYPDLVQPALQYGYAINTGIFGVTKDHEFLDRWIDVTIAGGGDNVPYTDELAAQVLAPWYEHYLAPQCWNYSVKYGNVEPLQNAKIIHYHGRKHMNDGDVGDMWRNSFDELRNVFPITDGYGDGKIQRHINANPVQTKDTEVTFVTAVNSKYLAKLVKNYETWQKAINIDEQNLIIFYDNTIDPVKDIKATWIPWEYTAPTDREKMLASFVFGVSDHVTTPYWIKLDADVTLDENVGQFWRGWKGKYDLVGHKWGYTKKKGDDTEGHWLNRLDDWWIAQYPDQKPLFPKITTNTHKHERIASFVCFHATYLSNGVTNIIKDTRMPVPSHDTLIWYVAKRMGLNILRDNLKRKGMKP